MNKHDYIMALAMNHGVAKVNVSGVEIPVMITSIESDNSLYRGIQTKFECQVVNEDQVAYVAKDILNTERAAKAASRTHHFEISRVYFNDPVTVVLWADGTKTIVRCQEGDTYSKETGLALCIAKKALGNKGNFNDIFHKWIPEDPKPIDIPVDTKDPFATLAANIMSKFKETLNHTVEDKTDGMP